VRTRTRMRAGKALPPPASACIFFFSTHMRKLASPLGRVCFFLMRVLFLRAFLFLKHEQHISLNMYWLARQLYRC
jgi:hypothetical protein